MDFPKVRFFVDHNTKAQFPSFVRAEKKRIQSSFPPSKEKIKMIKESDEIFPEDLEKCFPLAYEEQLKCLVHSQMKEGHKAVFITGLVEKNYESALLFKNPKFVEAQRKAAEARWREENLIVDQVFLPKSFHPLLQRKLQRKDSLLTLSHQETQLIEIYKRNSLQKKIRKLNWTPISTQKK